MHSVPVVPKNDTSGTFASHENLNNLLSFLKQSASVKIRSTTNARGLPNAGHFSVASLLILIYNAC